MKQHFLILCTLLISFGLMAFGYVNWNNSETVEIETETELYYHVSNRWSTITKEELKQVKSIHDIFQDKDHYTKGVFSNITISVLHNDKDVRDIEQFEMGQSEVFNTEQLELLHSCDYSTNLRITALNLRMDTETGVMRKDSMLRYMTIIPEKEAEFKGGFDALIGYLKASSKEKTAIITEDKLQPCKVFFTITNSGTIAKVKLNATSGYPSVDEALIKIISNMPENWKAAENSKGEKVDQEMVFSFGTPGC